MEHRRLLVIGGSGFIGRHLVARLAAQGRRILVPTRRREQAKHLFLLPGVEVVEADVHDPDTLRRLVTDRQAVVNLVGILHGRPGRPYGPEFARAHVELPRKVVEACRAAGVARLLHMSALGVSERGDALPSMYLRSKSDGERAVRESGLEWTIFRPSVVFGTDDRFINVFADLQRVAPLMAVGRAEARFQPVHVGDVAQAMVNALDRRETIGKAYELAGPETWTLRELIRLAGRLAGHPRPVFGLPDGLGRLQAAFLEMMPGPTLMSRDNFDSMAAPNVASTPTSAFPPELDIKPLALSVLAPSYSQDREMRLGRYRRGARR